MTARHAGPVAALSVVGAVVAVGLLVLLLTWASAIGPGEVLRGPGPTPPTPTETAVATSAGASPQDQRLPRRHDPNNKDLLRVVAVVLNVASVVVGVVLLVRLVRWARRARLARRRRLARRQRLDEADFEVREPAAVAAELLAGAQAQLDTLLAGTPRNAVVACWHRFETAAAAAGMERQVWETSSEFTLRVLDLVEADTAAVGRLGALYREARFSEHEVTEGDRTAAVAALEEIHRTIRSAFAGVLR